MTTFKIGDRVYDHENEDKPYGTVKRTLRDQVAIQWDETEPNDWVNDMFWPASDFTLLKADAPVAPEMTFKVGDRVYDMTCDMVPRGTVVNTRKFTNEIAVLWDGTTHTDGIFRSATDFAPLPTNPPPPVAPETSNVREMIASECDSIKDLLLTKNAAYGNSALDPVRIFSKADPVEQLKVRLDDKLSRIQRGTDDGEDVYADTIGYLVLLKIARKMATGAT